MPVCRATRDFPARPLRSGDCRVDVHESGCSSLPGFPPCPPERTIAPAGRRRVSASPISQMFPAGGGASASRHEPDGAASGWLTGHRFRTLSLGAKLALLVAAFVGFLTFLLT